MRIAAAGLFALFLFAPDGGGKPGLSDLEVAIQNGALYVDFELQGAFDDELIERIQTGLPTGFDFRLKLMKNQRWWFNRGIKSTKVGVVTMYNAVTGEYLVNYKQDGDLVESRVVRDVDALRIAMTSFESLRAFDLTDLDVKRSLWVEARAELGSRNLLLLIPITVQTDWSESKRFRLPNQGR